MTFEDAARLLPEFVAQCRCRNESHKNRAALAEHLANWLKKKHHGHPKPSQSAPVRSDGQCAQAGSAAAVATEDERHREVILRAYELMAGGR